MASRKTALITMSYLIEVSDEDLRQDCGRLNKLTEDMEEKLSSLSTGLQWQTTSLHVLDPETMNCGMCAACGGWTTDREKEGWLPALSPGAVVDGRLLCDECLPKDHPIAF